MKIISWNLLHSRGATAAHVHELILRHEPDLMLMQEATAAIDTLPLAAGGHCERLPLPGRHHGLAAWSRAPLHAAPTAFRLRSGLIIRRVCQVIDFGDWAVANVHLSHGQVLNRIQLRQIAAMLPARAAILGDCNLIGAPGLDGFEDIGPRFATHRSASILPLRLDRCFARGFRAESVEALAFGASDHRPILVRLAPA